MPFGNEASKLPHVASVQTTLARVAAFVALTVALGDRCFGLWERQDHDDDERAGSDDRQLHDPFREDQVRPACGDRSRCVLPLHLQPLPGGHVQEERPGPEEGARQSCRDQPGRRSRTEDRLARRPVRRPGFEEARQPDPRAA